MSDWKNGNPLLFSEGLPPFDEVKAEHVVPAVESLLADLEKELKAEKAKNEEKKRGRQNNKITQLGRQRGAA